MPKPKAIKVLLVEDHADIRRAMTLILNRSGYDVSVASTVKEAINKLDDQAFALIDLNLPDGTGLDVIEQIREREYPMRVAIITAAYDLQTPSKQLSSVDAIFQKPVDINKILSWIG